MCARLGFIAEQAEVLMIDEEGAAFKVLFLPRTDPLPDDASSGLGYYVEKLGLT